MPPRMAAATCAMVAVLIMGRGFSHNRDGIVNRNFRCLAYFFIMHVSAVDEASRISAVLRTSVMGKTVNLDLRLSLGEFNGP